MRPTESARQTSMFTSRSYGAGQSSMRRRGRAGSGEGAQQRLPEAARNARFFAGQRVSHSQFGEGTVITSRVLEDDEEVTVAFPGKGVKKLLATFANLKLLEGS